MNKIRFTAVPALLAIVSCWFPPAQAQPEAKFEMLLQEAISTAAGQNLQVSRAEIPPGYKSMSHSHPGETFVYVVSGRILNQIGDEEPKYYEAGDFFFEHANALHARFENEDPSVPAVVIIYGIRPATAN